MRPLDRKLLRDVGTHRAQFGAVIVTIFLGVTLFAASYDSYQNLTASYENTARESRFANLTVAGGDVASVAETARSTPGVESVDLRTVADAPIRVGDVKLLGRVVGIPVDRSATVNLIDVTSGTYPDATSTLVEEHMADHFDLAPGDRLEVLGPDGWREIVVSGTAASPEYIWPARDRQEPLTTPDNFGVIFVAESLSRSLAGSALPTEAIIYYDGGDEDAALSQALLEEAAASGANTSYTRAEQPSNAALSEDLKGFEELAVFFPALFLAAAAMATYVMLSRLVHSQQPHIGVLLANGYTRRQVLVHYLGYGAVPGLLGAVPGAIAGVLLARVITSLYTEMLAIPTTVVQFYPTTALAGIAFGLLTSLIAAGAPARRASRLLPADAMRGTGPTTAGRPSLAERLIPPLSHLPIRWRMALRGIERNPRRTAFTILGVVLSLTLVLVSWGMLDTIVNLMDRQFIEIQREDATVYFTTQVDDDVVAALTEVPGVSDAEAVAQAPVTLTAAGRYETTLFSLPADTTMRMFFAEDGSPQSLSADGLLLGSALRDILGVSEGSELTVSLAGIPARARVGGFVKEPLGTVAYASHSYASSVFGPISANAALVTYDPGAEPESVRAAITDVSGVAAFEDANALYETAQRYMVFFYVFVGVMLLFGGAMAFALIFSAMSVNIAERTREVATLQAVGIERRQISRMITAENLLVALIGIPLGLGAGYIAAGQAMASFNSDLFTFDLYIRPSTLAISSLAILLVALLSQWPGLRAIGRLDIARVVKERSL